MYELLGICIVLTALLMFNAAVSFVVATLWRTLLARPARHWSGATQARILFALRVFPPAGALFCALALIIPAYITHEPRTNGESLSIKLVLLASLSIAGLALAAWRAFSTLYATHRLARNWLRRAEPIEFDGVAVPSFRFRHEFPVIAVVGIFRPKLFVAEQIFETLCEEELRATIAHECGHLKARDNFKRALLRACHDALTIIPCGRALDRAWASAAEAAADEYAARKGSPVALDLAAALVKIAQLAPVGIRPTRLAGAFLFGDAEDGVAWRVRRLLQLAAREEKGEAWAAWLSKSLTWACLLALLAVGLYAVTHPGSLLTTHAAIEQAVATLQ